MEKVNIDQHHELVMECRNGNSKSQYEIYKLYSKAMYNTACNILNDDDEAADVLQESFLDAFTKISGFRYETTFGSWLKQIVVNNCLNKLRKLKISWTEIDSETEEIPDQEQLDEEEIEYRVNNIRKGINLLPDGYRVVLSMYLLEGFDHQEISQILNISENTSRSQYMRARQKLIEILKQTNKDGKA